MTDQPQSDPPERPAPPRQRDLKPLQVADPTRDMDAVNLRTLDERLKAISDELEVLIRDTVNPGA